MKLLAFLEHHDGEPAKGALGAVSKAASLGEAAAVAVGAG
ncbi:MAG: electron transfer flavoprotein subunit alpha, partial [Thermoleophilia bacterium]